MRCQQGVIRVKRCSGAKPCWSPPSLGRSGCAETKAITSPQIISSHSGRGALCCRAGTTPPVRPQTTTASSRFPPLSCASVRGSSRVSVVSNSVFSSFPLCLACNFELVVFVEPHPILAMSTLPTRHDGAPPIWPGRLSATNLATACLTLCPF